MDDVCVTVILCLRVNLPIDLCVGVAKRVLISNKIARRLPLSSLGRGTSKSAFKRR